MTIRYSSLISILLLFGRHAADVHGCDKHGVHNHLGGRHGDHINDDDDDEDTPNDDNLQNHGDDDNLKQKLQGNLRRLQGIYDDYDDDNDTILPELISSTTNHPCKDGEPTFTVGNVSYVCQTAFQQQDGFCATAAMSPDEKVKADEHYQAWEAFKDKKEEKVNGGDQGGEWRRRLGGCGDCVDWTKTTITIPTYIHVIYSGTTGKKFTYAV
jgi:hypothetical protein